MARLTDAQQLVNAYRENARLTQENRALMCKVDELTVENAALRKGADDTTDDFDESASCADCAAPGDFATTGGVCEDCLAEQQDDQ
jgi:hypothetical protein